MKKFLLLLVFGLLSAASAKAACSPATVDLVVRDPSGKFLPGAKFYVYQQVADVNGNPKPGKQVGAGTTDKYTGRGTAKVTVSTTTPENYAVMVANPSLKNADFWYFNELSLECGRQVEGEITLSGFRVRAQDFAGVNALSDIKIKIYGQAISADQNEVKGDSLGSADTGSEAVAQFYTPSPERSLVESPKNYLLEIKNSKGQNYYRYDLQATDQEILSVLFSFSELAVTVRDAEMSNPLPGVKLELAEQLSGGRGGKTLANLTTDNNGAALIQYPAGTYVLRYKGSNGLLEEYPGVVIEEQKRATANILLKGFSQYKCSIKSNLRLNLTDVNGEVLGDLSFNLYEQKISKDGYPQTDVKVVSGAVDAGGFAKTSFSPSPAKRYALEVCDKNAKLSCHFIYDLNFACQDQAVISRRLPLVKIILRTMDKKLATGSKLSVYQATVNVDGQTVVDKSKLVGNYTLPVSGVLKLKLAAKDNRGQAIKYVIIVAGLNKQELIYNFTPTEDSDNKIELINYGDHLSALKPPTPSTSTVGAAKGLKGRILLQVESKGEAWYVSPKDGKRYSLGRPADAFGLMRRMSVGIKNDDLKKIPVALNLISGTDGDNDGLPDDLEKALGTDPDKRDSDGDTFSDFEELNGGFNPAGGGQLSLNKDFAREQYGKILLAVEARGEAWYVSPKDGKRYFLGRPADAFNVMRGLGLGITNQNLNSLTAGE